MTRLTDVGAWGECDPPILVVLDAGYDVIRLSWLLADRPVLLVARIRSDRVMRGPAPAARSDGRPGRRTPRDHPSPLRAGPGAAWGDLHPDLERRRAWAVHHGKPPIIEGAVVNVTVEHLPGDRAPKPMSLWCSDPVAAGADPDWWWRS